MSPPRRSIQQKITVLILTICLVPAVVFVTFIVLGSRALIEDTVGLQLKRNTAVFADRFSQFVEREMERFAAALDPQRHAEALADRPDAALPMIVRLDERRGVQRVFPERELPLHGFIEDFLSRWPPDDWPPKGAAQAALTDAAIPIPGSVHPLRTLIAVFDDPSGGRVCVVEDLTAWIERFRQSLTEAPEFFALGSDRHGMLFASRTLEPEAAERLEAAARRVEREPFRVRAGGVRYLMAAAETAATARLRAAHGWGAVWSVFLPFELDAFLQLQNYLIWLSALIALGLVVALMMIASVATHRLVLPLQTLKQQAMLLAQGQMDVRATVAAPDEIGELSDAFNVMARRLEAMYRSLAERAEETRRHAEHIHAINEIANAILQEQTMEAIFDLLRRQLGNLLRFDALWLALFDGEGSHLRVTQIYPIRLISLFDNGRLPLSWSLHGRVVEARETLHAEIGPAHRTEFFETRLFNAEGFQSFLIAPLPSRDRILGTLTVASAAPDSFASSDLLTILASLARAVAIAIEHAAMFEQISRFAGELEHKVAERSKELAVATQKLIQTEKYFALGRLAGNIAHEINNPLGIIKNYLQMVKMNLERAGGGRRASDPNADHLRVIDEEVNRIARLVRRMLDLHRPVEATIEAVDLNALIDDTLSIMEQSFRRASIEVVREFATDLPMLMASSDLMRQVLINLLRNAQDAMEQGGRITIRTSAVTEWEPGGAGEPGRERQIVRLRISDTGCGIPPEYMSQIFDPFFTTKPQEKGSGLGLCVSYSIVRMYQGTIDVQSEPGQGTTVTVSLPVLESGAQATGAHPPDPARAADGAG